jgi:transposase
VRARTQLINHVRGAVNAVGGRLPASSAPAFPRRVAPEVPTPLQPALQPLLALIEALTVQILAAETARLRQVAGVGPLTSLCYVLTLEDPAHFRTSRAVGAYLGLCPKPADSGTAIPSSGLPSRAMRCSAGCW